MECTASRAPDLSGGVGLDAVRDQTRAADDKDTTVRKQRARMAEAIFTQRTCRCERTDDRVPQFGGRDDLASLIESTGNQHAPIA